MLGVVNVPALAAEIESTSATWPPEVIALSFDQSCQAVERSSAWEREIGYRSGEVEFEVFRQLDGDSLCLMQSAYGAPIGSWRVDGVGWRYLLHGNDLGSAPTGQGLATVAWFDGGPAGDTTYRVLRRSSGGWHWFELVADYPHPAEAGPGEGWRLENGLWKFEGAVLQEGPGRNVRHVDLPLDALRWP